MSPLKWRNLTVLLALVAVLLLPAAANATLVPVLLVNGTATNTITSPSGVYATGAWENNFSITSKVNRSVDGQQNYVYEYVYSAFVPEKEFSHFIIEVSANAPSTNFWGGTVNGISKTFELDDYSTDNGNPGIPYEITGIKFDNLSGITIDFSFFSYNAPVWQNFYSKDGTGVYAYNMGFANNASINYESNYIIGPDSVGGKVPIPASVLLMGSGLVGMGILGWRRKKA